jgi:hypothetical protein
VILGRLIDMVVWLAMIDRPGLCVPDTSSSYLATVVLVAVFNIQGRSL